MKKVMKSALLVAAVLTAQVTFANLNASASTGVKVETQTATQTQVAVGAKKAKNMSAIKHNGTAGKKMMGITSTGAEDVNPPKPPPPKPVAPVQTGGGKKTSGIYNESKGSAAK